MTKTREEFSQDNYPNEVLLSLQESWDNILSQDCEELGISKEDLLIRLVRKYVYFDRFTIPFSIILSFINNKPNKSTEF